MVRRCWGIARQSCLLAANGYIPRCIIALAFFSRVSRAAAEFFATVAVPFSESLFDVRGASWLGACNISTSFGAAFEFEPRRPRKSLYIAIIATVRFWPNSVVHAWQLSARSGLSTTALTVLKMSRALSAVYQQFSGKNHAAITQPDNAVR